MQLALPVSYVEIEQEEMMYLDRGKVSERVWKTSTGYKALYGVAIAFGANAVYGGAIGLSAAASGIGIPFAVIIGMAAGYQGYLAGKFGGAGSDAEILFSRYGKYKVVITTILGCPTGVRVESELIWEKTIKIIS